jgi:hypothetical protein
MDYNYKYLKYKNKYLELKGGKMEYGLYGLYSYFNNNPNLRTNNKRFNEINYIHNLPLYKDANNNLIDPKIIDPKKYKYRNNIIIKHLLSKYKIKDNITEYYSGIKSFEFVPYDGVSLDDIDKIQKLIDTTYFTKELYKDENGNVKWTELNKLKKFRYKGYSNEISEDIINSYADKAKELLENEASYKSDKANITEIRKKALELQRNRKCNYIYKYPNKSINSQDSYRRILLDELIEDNNMQLLLSNVKTGESYEKNNPKIYRDPFTLVNEKLGVLSWNMIINKATINCIMNHHEVLFPMRIILDMNPETLFYDNILQTARSSDNIVENNKYSNYMGFFLIKFERDIDDYTKYSIPHKSKEQYYIYFIFKNEIENFNFPLYTYTLTNFRNNIVNWGTVTEKKTVLFYEILQLICMYLNNNVHFYLVSSENKSEKNKNIESWIYTEDLRHINFDNEIHILVSKDNIDTVAKKLEKDIWFITNTKYRHIEHDGYKLIECHFGWYDDDVSKDRFCIKLGDMNEDDKQKIKKNACINDINSDLYKLDKIRYIQPIGLNNITKPEDIINFDLNSNPIMDIELKKLIKKKLI